jgi:predicted ATPase
MRLCVHFQPKSEHREDGQEFNLFKHALVQDAAYGTLLREPRRVLHTRIAETL